MSELVDVNEVPSGTSSRLQGDSTDEVLIDAMNLAVALLALFFLAPVMLAVGLAVFLRDGGPVIFAHRRIGRGGRYFYCLKFRSMAVGAEHQLAELLTDDPIGRAEWEENHKLRNDPRVTRFGAFLRRTSLDELPQLFNVLRGDMSMVGPRPIVDAEVAKYGHRFALYCAVKPGLTGLWQVSGRTDTSYRARVAMDCIYARRRSLMMDAMIIAATPPAVLLRRGSY